MKVILKTNKCGTQCHTDFLNTFLEILHLSPILLCPYLEQSREESGAKHFLKNGILTFIVTTAVFWNAMTCSLVDGYQSFGRTCYLHLQSRRETEVWENRTDIGRAKTMTGVLREPDYTA
jgi:hypothetical protein